MRFAAPSLDGLKLELETEFDGLRSPGSPVPVYACLEADLPAAADYKNCVVLVTDLNILAHSDGADWIRSDTGAAI